MHRSRHKGRHARLMQCICGAECIWPNCRCAGVVGGDGKFKGHQCQRIYSAPNPVNRTIHGDQRDQWCDKTAGCSREYISEIHKSDIHQIYTKDVPRPGYAGPSRPLSGEWRQALIDRNNITTVRARAGRLSGLSVH